MRHLRTIISKEWAETIRNKLLLAGIFVMPAIFLLVTLGILAVTNSGPVDQAQIAPYIARSPELAALEPREAFQMVLVNEFLFLFLLTPSVIPMTLASYSIIGEKQARSLEPLLATPVSTVELLFGKTLAAIVPAIGVTWLAYALYLVGASEIASDHVLGVLLSATWLLAILVIGPLIGVLSVLIGVIISSRFNDTRVAQQLGGLIALPIAGFGVAQASGALLVDLGSFAAGFVVLVAIDALAFYITVRQFQRDRILTEWK
jgi:ABC-2 type transport system permease protein